MKKDLLIDDYINFKADYTLDGYAELMALIFEDERFKKDDLLEPVYDGIVIGHNKYKDNNRDTDYFSYVTFFVKRQVLKFKKAN